MTTNGGHSHEVNLLVEEYKLRSRERLDYEERYNSQTRYLGLVATFLIALGGILASFGKVNLASGTLRSGAAIGLTVAGLELLYLLATLVVALYMIYANEAEMVDLEARINEMAGAELLRWHRHLAEIQPLRVFIASIHRALGAPRLLGHPDGVWSRSSSRRSVGVHR